MTDTTETGETGFTPGPWEAYPWSHPMRKARHLILGTKENGASPVVAEVYGKADADLIASAHALRDACNMALDWISELPSDSESRRFTLQTLRAALAKTKGGQS